VKEVRAIWTSIKRARRKSIIRKVCFALLFSRRIRSRICAIALKEFENEL
jgi:hypothetical protein